MAGKIENKVAVITGAARGMGQTIAVAYRREGAYLSLWDIDEKGLKETAGEITPGGDDGVLCLKTDVTRENEVDAAVHATLERFGRIDALVNSAALKMAAIVPREKRATYRFWEIDPDRWRRLLEVNLTGTFLCCRRIAEEMVRRRGGSIINMTTGDETKLRRGYSPYGASKAAVEVFSLAIAKELKPDGVRVNLLQPGGAVNLRGENSPALLPYDVIVPAALFLASDESRDRYGEMIVAS
ncbi:MAG TPA: SDR family oxidoreductase, partial [Candidatus Binatia bacterium]|nr:SDR family oxidoreductase [Candidatus Binatia bacterium]